MNKKHIAALAIAISLTGCGTIFTGTSQRVSVDSQPQNAEILVNGNSVSYTPSTVTIPKSVNGATIILKKEGYKTKSIYKESQFNPVSILNLFGIFEWVIDAISGGMWKYDTTPVDVQLKKK